jgi:nicotinate-nucleotide adenylyltransferase
MSTHPTFTPPHVFDSARWRGKRIGLLGGSFNPAHHGHLHIAKMAMAKLGLDFVWWLVTPQNPMKSRTDMAPYEERFRSVQTIIGRNPGMMATHLEAQLGTTYTFETVNRLKTLFPQTEFVFICGHDNALIFHKWDRWKTLANLIPIVFIARPPATRLVQNCPIRMLKPQKFPMGRKTPLLSGHVYWLKMTRMIDISSTEIRNKTKR